MLFIFEIAVLPGVCGFPGPAPGTPIPSARLPLWRPLLLTPFLLHRPVYLCNSQSYLAERSSHHFLTRNFYFCSSKAQMGLSTYRWKSTIDF